MWAAGCLRKLTEERASKTPFLNMRGCMNTYMKTNEWSIVARPRRPAGHVTTASGRTNFRFFVAQRLIVAQRLCRMNPPQPINARAQAPTGTFLPERNAVDVLRQTAHTSSEPDIGLPPFAPQQPHAYVGMQAESFLNRGVCPGEPGAVSPERGRVSPGVPGAVCPGEPGAVGQERAWRESGCGPGL